MFLHNAIESGEYNNTSDAITAALRFFFQHTDIKQVKDEVAVVQSEIQLLNTKNQILETKVAPLESQMKHLMLSRERYFSIFWVSGFAGELSSYFLMYESGKSQTDVVILSTAQEGMYNACFYGFDPKV